jgi:hypothetical protein
MTDRRFEYDVAFSFHSADEQLAISLNDRLSDRFATFIYLDRQKELAGRDGEEMFNSVFGKRARLVVALVRPEWGETPFTRIEQTAIKNRAFDSGYDFALFIPTTSPPAIPPWVPRTRLYLSGDRFGLDGTAAVIEAAIQTAGGNARVETLFEKGARLQRAHALRQEQEQFTRSERGVKEATAAFQLLTSTMQEKLVELGQAHAQYSNLRVAHRVWEIWTLTGLRPFMTFGWECQYANTLEGAALGYALYSGPINLPGSIPPLREGRKLRSGKFCFGLFDNGSTGYFEQTKDQRTFSPVALADTFLGMYIEAADKLEDRGT